MKFEVARDEFIYALCKKASTAYYLGSPIISDEQFDYLADLCDFKEVGHKIDGNTKKHYWPMYSLQKYYQGEGKLPLAEYTHTKVSSPKLDGAAISCLYIQGSLAMVLTRGDGVEGRDITDKFLFSTKAIIPKSIDTDLPFLQVTGEVTTLSSVTNARNYASGALNLLDLEEFNNRDLYFTAYGLYPYHSSYLSDMNLLYSMGFHTVLEAEWCSNFLTDGLVVRINDNELYQKLGNTAKHPRGAYAVKVRKEGVVTKLLSVDWQVGKSGKVTPVAILEPCIINGATVTRATLNNQAFIEALDLEIDCLVEVQRMGDIIPGIVRKVEVND